MPSPDSSPSNDDHELVNESPQAAIDMETLAEKIFELLRREMELEAERFGTLFSGR